MKIILVINIILLLYIQKIDAAKSLYKIQQNERIVNGIVTTIRKAKFVVYISVDGEFRCGGSLVTPKYVVTAAHCVEGVENIDLTVTGGATYLSEEGVKRNVSKIFVHKEFNIYCGHMDVAVLELSEALIGDNISPIELCKSELEAKDQVSVYGWGQMSEDNVNPSNQLRMINIPIVDRRRCRKMYWGICDIIPEMFCAGGIRGKSSCFGDSGGPAVFNNQLCGVISGGVGCGRNKFPGLYTNIASFLDFINEIIEKE
ncbi:seminase-like [Cochliomyia hominivorax]